MGKFDRLFEPCRIGTLEVKNRIVMAAMGTGAADAEGFATDRLIDFYVARAKGGTGMIICTGLRIRPAARVGGLLCGFDDKYIPRLKDLTRAIKEAGARAAIQISDQGKVLSERGIALHPDAVGPSPIPWVKNGVTAREATKEDIKQLTENFADAALRAKVSGFEAVEIHGAHGYLIGSFSSPFTNKRTDEYGGTPEKRARFACEILKRTREKLGPDFPIMIRVSGSEFIHGGITIEDTLKQVPLFVEAGANAIHVSASSQETPDWLYLCYLRPDAAIIHLAEAVKRVVKVPVIGVGKLGDQVVVERVIAEGKVDFIAMARGLLADPDWANKVREGRVEDITACLYCNNCTGRSRPERIKFGGNFCTVNPALGREREFAIKPAERRKKVMVVGGGLAGMEAARVLAERGHEVSLFEKSDKLGGQWNLACTQEPKKVRYSLLRDRLIRGLDKAGVKVSLNKEVTAAQVKQARPDAVVVATGAVPATIPCPGADRSNVVQAVDVIAGKAKIGKEVVVIGGRLLGMEVADYLAEKGMKVSIITLHKLGENGKPAEAATSRALRERLIGNGVAVYPDSPAWEITEDGVYADANHDLLFLKADTVVMAVGARPNNALAKELQGVVPEVYSIGDCVEARDALVAIREGAEVARQI